MLFYQMDNGGEGVNYIKMILIYVVREPKIHMVFINLDITDVPAHVITKKLRMN